MNGNINWNRCLFILLAIASILMNAYAVFDMGNLFSCAVSLLLLTMLWLLFRPGKSRLSTIVIVLGGIFTVVGALFLILGGIAILYSDLPDWACILGTILLIPGLTWGKNTAVGWYEERRTQL